MAGFILMLISVYTYINNFIQAPGQTGKDYIGSPRYLRLSASWRPN